MRMQLRNMYSFWQAVKGCRVTAASRVTLARTKL